MIVDIIKKGMTPTLLRVDYALNTHKLSSLKLQFEQTEGQISVLQDSLKVIEGRMKSLLDKNQLISEKIEEIITR